MIHSTVDPAIAAEFATMLDAMLQNPERRKEIEGEILQRFSVARAVMILDMSGFSRTTRTRGIVTFLLMIHQVRRVCEPAIVKYGGVIVKAEADNLYCLFDDVPAAVTAARDMRGRLEAVNCVMPDDQKLYASIGIGYGEILYIGQADFFGDEVNLASKLGEDIAGQGEVLLTAQASKRLPAEELARCEKSAVTVSGIELEYFQLG